MARPVLYEFGEFEFNATARTLKRLGEPVPLTSKAAECLALLLERPGEVLTKSDLVGQLWPDAVVEENSLAQQIAAVRRALSEKAGENRFVVTIPGRGYSFVAPVKTPSPLVDEPVPKSAPAPTPPPLAMWSVAAVALAVLAAALVVRGRTGSSGQRYKIVPITSMRGYEAHPTFSPDGSQIAFSHKATASEPWQIFVKVIGQEEPLRLTSDRGGFAPVWSPNGKWIAYLRTRPEGCCRVELVLISPLGGAERKLTEIEADEASPHRWTSNSAFLMVTRRAAPDAPLEIHAISAETGEWRQITSPPAKSWGDTNPTPSPDGKWLAFARSMTAGAPEIRVMPVSGLPAPADSRVVVPSDGNLMWHVMWSGDSERLMFIRNYAVDMPVFRVRRSGGSPEFVMNLGFVGGPSSVSRDGKRLAFSNFNNDVDIWRLDLRNGRPLAGTEPRRIVASTVRDYEPQISPDGRKIAFASNRTGKQQIWLADADGRHQRQLTEIDGPINGTPRWSPDGRYIAFDARVSGNGDIYTVELETQKITRVTTDAATDHIPSWSADGKWIYYSSQRDGQFRIWKTPAAGGEHHRVTAHTGWGGFESRDGEDFYFADAFSAPSIWRVPTAGGREEKVLEGVTLSHDYTILRDGIYFKGVPPPKEPPKLWFFDFKTRQRTLVFDSPLRLFTGMDVAADASFLLYSALEVKDGDIFMLEGLE